MFMLVAVHSRLVCSKASYKVLVWAASAMLEASSALHDGSDIRCFVLYGHNAVLCVHNYNLATVTSGDCSIDSCCLGHSMHWHQVVSEYVHL